MKAKLLGRKVLDEVANLVTPDTLLAWYRNLIARKWTYAQKGPGRPRVSKEITELVLRMARDNPTWGYDRFQGVLANLGHTVSSSTVANIRNHQGVGNQLLEPSNVVALSTEPVQRRERLGGLLSFYHREAA